MINGEELLTLETKVKRFASIDAEPVSADTLDVWTSARNDMQEALTMPKLLELIETLKAWRTDAERLAEFIETIQWDEDSDAGREMGANALSVMEAHDDLVEKAET